MRCGCGLLTAFALMLVACTPQPSAPAVEAQLSAAAPTHPPDAPTVVRFNSADGASLACKRYAREGATPVLLIHGLAINADSWDLPPLDEPDSHYRSLASTLRGAGFDVWLLNLRGHGNGASRSRPPAGQTDWTIDHFALYDVPAAIDVVLGATGRKPFVVASSLGAMALAVWLEGAAWSEAEPGHAAQTAGSGNTPAHLVADPVLAGTRQATLAGAVLIAFPAALRWPESTIDEAGRVVWGSLFVGLLRGGPDANVVFESAAHSPGLQGALDLYGSLPLRFLRPNEDIEAWENQLSAPLAAFLDGVDKALFALGADLVGTFNGESTGRLDVILSARGVVLEDVEAGVLRQFARSIRAGAFVSELSEPPLIYSEHYANIALPTLLILGGRDRNANATTVREAFFDVIAATDKTLRVFESLGHGEFEMAPAATELVYPEILAWLHARDTSP